MSIFSLHIREILELADLEFEKLQEIRLRAMGPLAIRYAGEEFFLKENGKIGREPEGAWMVTGREIQETMEFVGKYSLYAYEDELRQGFLTLRGGLSWKGTRCAASAISPSSTCVCPIRSKAVRTRPCLLCAREKKCAIRLSYRRPGAGRLPCSGI